MARRRLGLTPLQARVAVHAVSIGLFVSVAWSLYGFCRYVWGWSHMEAHPALLEPILLIVIAGLVAAAAASGVSAAVLSAKVLMRPRPGMRPAG